MSFFQKPIDFFANICYNISITIIKSPVSGAWLCIFVGMSEASFMPAPTRRKEVSANGKNYRVKKHFYGV